MEFNFLDKLGWIKKAADLDIDTEKGNKEFLILAKESKLGKERLVYYANAYESAGESGVKALTYKSKMPAEICEEAMNKFNQFLSKRVPEHLRSEIGFLVKAEDNMITVSEKRPLFGDPSQASCIEIFQVRYTDFDKRWHLYWMRKTGKWWPYIPKKPVCTIEDCIREVKADSWGCFWG